MDADLHPPQPRRPPRQPHRLLRRPRPTRRPAQPGPVQAGGAAPDDGAGQGQDQDEGLHQLGGARRLDFEERLRRSGVRRGVAPVRSQHARAELQQRFIVVGGAEGVSR